MTNAQFTQLEWLETNGLGGFASSTLCGMNTRRYHGLLIAATVPPTGRTLLLSKLEETLIVGGRRFDFSTNQYEGAVYPQGVQYLKSYRLQPFPAFTFGIEGIEIEKRVFMVQGQNATVVEYELRESADCQLELRPLLAFRDFHATTHANPSINGAFQNQPGLLTFQPYPGLPRLHLAHNAVSVNAEGHWYYNFEYPIEKERGLDAREDLFCPAVLGFDFSNCSTARVAASAEWLGQVGDVPPSFGVAPVGRCDAEGHAHNGRAETGQAGSDPPSFGAAPRGLGASIDLSTVSDVPRPSKPAQAVSLISSLTAVARQFIVQRGNLHTVMAGYHWFGDWGRDTMIALPGLTLATGRFDVARDILLTFAGYLDQGMLPNRFPDAGEKPEYNTVDATLWFFEAIRAYVKYTGDLPFVRDRLYAPMKSILDHHLAGTRYGIRVDTDALLHAGEPGVQLTWMDAKIGDWVVTPRQGKPVEIQALWYNALCVAADLATAFEDPDTALFLEQLAERARASFQAQFWNAEAGCLYDVVDGDSKDGSIRPNQVIALSLHHALVTGSQALAVLAVVERDLLTPYGLRTLAPSDARYRGRYEGGLRDRDAAYHQGPVWPWLTGPFVSAYVKAHGRTAESKARAAGWLQAIFEHPGTTGIGQIPELLDGDAPHQARGCLSQAWSVAEILRAAVEEL